MEYEVGKYYNVVCMEERNMYNKKEPHIFVPIIDIHHKDAQFGADYLHYHVDGRFASRKIQSIFSMDDGRTNCIVGHPNALYQPIKKVVKTLKCKRWDTGLKVWVLSKTNSKYWIWYNSMVGKSCAGKKCPHLGTEMLERNGQLVCPLHNLVGCKEKEIIIPQ